MTAVVTVSFAGLQGADHALIEQAANPVSPRLAAYLAPVAARSRFDEHGAYSGQTEHWTPPATVPAEAHDELHHHLELVTQALAPAGRGALLARIHTLLAQYRQDDRPAAVEQAIAGDWADDLEEFPQWAVEQACRDWRRHPTKYRFKPLPGDIRALALAHVAKLVTLRHRLGVLLALARPAPIEPAAAPVNTRPDIHARIRQLAAAKRMG